jgi:hypothetical protein
MSTKINSTPIIYNGYSIRQILSKMPPKLKSFKPHRNLYIENCIIIYENELTKTNLGYCEAIRNMNFNLIKIYLNL